MSKSVRRTAICLAALLGVALGLSAQAATVSSGSATHHHAVRSGHRGLYGGKTWEGKEHVFETVFTPDGLRIYMFTPERTPASLEGASGTVTLKFKDGSTKELTLAPQGPASGDKTIYYCTMHPDVMKTEAGKCPKCNMDLVAQNRFFGAADLSQAKPGTVTAEIHLTGLGGNEKEVTFTEVNGHGRNGNPKTEGTSSGGAKS